ncbi:hypothetical protein GUITHDRAFT_141634 [Guillardia theta CCMP2712]|uniref:Uncharacterized protein n=1 Tax=Guillardia theta (strain CCMP2712) TaxID=905079 RepID=L1J072_GUITC|nr:hypothetical protein GUITHDRAFT_141634 [Guillardia theta CCMP2712]EKX41881.1 hypothetical protein GUITHDRAFT_141634 [Guillardia theta CCMP2712]|eukprot:XP_005828861.1 hypothetical protein GUITHDRAFT_141634 [Guillardia theta CCMP2712]
MNNMLQFNQITLKDAISQLKAATEVTMETVGVRFSKRVSTGIYREGLSRLDGTVTIQPPSEDRVSIFISLVGGKQACLKVFSTGKLRCLKSDFQSSSEAQYYAQSIIDRMANTRNSGMPPIKLQDAKFHENYKDFTWSTRQTTDIRKLSKALQAAGIKAENDTSFGDSVMVVISPPGTDRQIKGCRGDAESAARAVALSLNMSGCLQGGAVDLTSIKCEVWLTKRHFQACGEENVINIDRLHEILNDTRLRRTEHTVLNQWMKAKGEIDFVRQVQKVGTVCPRIEVKFLPLTIDEWEEQRRCKPEPVSISIHQKGEVQLAGNAEYKVLQAFWYISDKIAKGGATLLLPNLSKSRDSSNASNTGRGSKRKLEVAIPPASVDQVGKAPVLTSPKPTPKGKKKCTEPCAGLVTPATVAKHQRIEPETISLGTPNVSAVKNDLFKTNYKAHCNMDMIPLNLKDEFPEVSSKPFPTNATEILAQSENVFHNRQLVYLYLLQNLYKDSDMENTLTSAHAPVDGEIEVNQEPLSPTDRPPLDEKSSNGRETPISPTKLPRSLKRSKADPNYVLPALKYGSKTPEVTERLNSIEHIKAFKGLKPESVQIHPIPS